MKLECADCHATGDIEAMRLHVRSVHQRELMFDEDDYREPIAEHIQFASAVLLHPDFILSA